MRDYLLFESRDPFESADVPSHYELAASLARRGARVSLFLVQDGVLPARRGVRRELADLAGQGVEVLADDFSLRERGIDASALPPGIRVASMDVALERLVEGRNALWF